MDKKKNFFFVKTYNNGKPYTHELKLIAEKRNIKDYKKMSREELLRTFDESGRFLQNLSQNGPERIAKIQNLSQNEIKQIKKMQNFSRDELEQIAKKKEY